MKAARLRHRLTIKQATEAADSYGAAGSITWADVVTVWGSVEPIRGREYFDAKQVNAETTHRIGLRYRAGVTTKMRIYLGSRIFEVLEVLNPSERNRELQIMAKEAV